MDKVVTCYEVQANELSNEREKDMNMKDITLVVKKIKWQED